MSLHKSLTRLSVFIVILVGLMFVAQRVLVVGLKQYRAGDRGRTNRMIHGQINADVLCTGSSRVEVHMDSRILSAGLNRSCYNLGRSGVLLDLQLPYLKTYLLHNRHPQLLIQGLDISSLKPTDEVYRPNQYIPYLNEPELFDALVRLEPAFKIAKELPLYGICKFRCSTDAILGLLHLEPAEQGILGYLPMDLKWQDDFERFRRSNAMPQPVNMSAAGESALKGILDLCSKRRIAVVLVYPPEYYQITDLFLGRDRLLQRFKKIAEDYGVLFLDYSEHLISYEKSNFYNSQHLNRYGAEVFSKDLAKRLAVLEIWGSNTPVRASL